MATYTAPSVMAAKDYVRSRAQDGDVIVVESEYQKAMVESLAIALGLDVIVEVKGR